STGVGKKDRVQTRWHSPGQLLRQQAGQQGAIHLDEVGTVQSDHILDRLLDHGVAAAQVERAISGSQIKVSIAVSIPQKSPLSPAVYLVEADDCLNTRQAGVDVLPVQSILFAMSTFNELTYRPCHGVFLESGILD